LRIGLDYHFTFYLTNVGRIHHFKN